MTLDELIAATGFPDRTIRHYTQHGLLPGGAYGDRHVVLLMAIGVLKEQGVHRLESIKARLDAMTPEQLEEFVTPGAREGGVARPEPPASPAEGTPAVPSDPAHAEAEGERMRKEEWTRVVLRTGLELSLRRGARHDVEDLFDRLCDLARSNAEG